MFFYLYVCTSIYVFSRLASECVRTFLSAHTSLLRCFIMIGPKSLSPSFLRETAFATRWNIANLTWPCCRRRSFGHLIGKEVLVRGEEADLLSFSGALHVEPDKSSKIRTPYRHHKYLVVAPTTPARNTPENPGMSERLCRT